MPEITNLFSDIPSPSGDEFVEILASGSGEFHLERIVSHGHQSAPDFWYANGTTEWVVLLSGSATLEFINPDKTIELKPGDWMEIPPLLRHRVIRTQKDVDTVWLALHWK